MNQQGKQIGLKRAVVTFLALALCLAMFIIGDAHQPLNNSGSLIEPPTTEPSNTRSQNTNSSAVEAPGDSDSVIKSPMIKPSTVRAQTGSARVSTTRRRRRARRRRARTKVARIATPKVSVKPRQVQSVSVSDAPGPEAVTTTPRRPKGPVSGGVLNGKALTLPAPVYSAIARAANARGEVTVRVLIDEDGKVTEAQALSGHALLRTAAEEAAMTARFAPTQLSGVPVKVTGVITYNFVP